MNGWQTTQSKTVYTNGRWLTVEERDVVTPSGVAVERWNWITTPDYINVIAQTTEGQYIVFRQGKYGLEDDSLAPVGGYIEPGEDPLNAARRELLEETGYQASHWQPLGGYIVDPNRGVAMGYFFLARGAVAVGSPGSDDLEQQHLLLLSREELIESLAQNRFKVQAWAFTIALALLQPPL